MKRLPLLKLKLPGGFRLNCSQGIKMTSSLMSTEKHTSLWVYYLFPKGVLNRPVLINFRLTFYKSVSTVLLCTVISNLLLIR